MPLAASSSRSTQTSESRSTTDSESVSTGINTSTAWGQTTSRATGDSESLAVGLQRSREFLVEQHELQQLPASAMIITYAGPGGRQVVLADANPGIGGLRAATWLTLEEFRSPASGPAAAAGPGTRETRDRGRPGGWLALWCRAAAAQPGAAAAAPRLAQAPFLTGGVADRPGPAPAGERCRQRWRARSVT